MRRLVPVAAVSLALLTVAYLAGRVSAGSGPVPGSASDPLVTQSYVTKAIARAIGSSAPTTSASTSFDLVRIDTGQTLTVGENAEVIVRRGTSSAVVTARGGVVDLTAGADLTTGDAVSINHLLLVPKDDGCGLTASSYMIILVSGTFKVASSSPSSPS